MQLVQVSFSIQINIIHVQEGMFRILGVELSLFLDPHSHLKRTLLKLLGFLQMKIGMYLMRQTLG